MLFVIITMALDTPTDCIFLTITTLFAFRSHMVNIHRSVITPLATYRTDIVLGYLNLSLPVMLVRIFLNS